MRACILMLSSKNLILLTVHRCNQGQLFCYLSNDQVTFGISVSYLHSHLDLNKHLLLHHECKTYIQILRQRASAILALAHLYQ